MLLTIDVGNTQTHVGAFDGPELVEHWRFSTDRQSTGDELAVTLHNLLGLREIRFDQIHAVNLATLAGLAPSKPAGLQDLLALDAEARRFADQAMRRLAA